MKRLPGNQIMLITYADSMGRSLRDLEEVLEEYFDGAIGGLHILPFYPSTADRGFAPAVVALLPWGGALLAPAMQMAGSAAIEAKRRFGRGATGLAALSQAESQVKAGNAKLEHEVKHKRVAGLSALSRAEQKAKDPPKDASHE